MAPLPIEIELTQTDNQSAMSTQVVSSVAGSIAVNLDKTGYNATTTVNLDKAGYNATTTVNLDKTGYNATTTVNLDKTGYTVSTVQDKTGYNATTTVNLDKTGYSLTAAEEATIASTIWTTTQPESFRGLNSVGNMSQLMYEILANQVEFANSGTTRTLNSVTSHTAITVTYGYDSSTTPASIKRTA